MASKLDYICRSLSKGTSKVYETYVVNAIWQRLSNDNIEFVTQQYVFKEGRKSYIDMYFPQIALAIEVDEMYHNSNDQINSDNERMNRIQLASLDSLVSNDKVVFERIHIGDLNGQFDLRFINKRIDEVVSVIKTKYEEKGSPKWVYDNEEKISNILKSKHLKRGDSFYYMTDILKLFGFNYKGFQKCYKYVGNNFSVWSPYLSYDEEDNNIRWNNTISKDLRIISERDRDGNVKTQKGFEENKNMKRLVFLNYRDPLGIRGRKFLGVYKVKDYNDITHTERWELVSEEFDLW